MNYIFVVSGFTQKRYAKHGSGCIQIFEDLLKYNSPDTEVQLLEWNEDPEGWARHVAARTKGPDDKILVCAYSYGGGWWFRLFAEKLKHIGIKVNTAVLCDPVYRRPWYSRWLQWRAVTKWWPQELEYPDNIKRIVHFVQYQNEPGGDVLIMHGPVDYVGPNILELPHVKMDNAPQFRAACVNEAERLFS